MPILPLRVAARLRIRAAPDAVWRLLTDTRAWPRWGPSVRRVESSHRFIQAGTAGRVRTAAGVWLPFEITEFEPGRYWAWRVAGVRATGHRVDPDGPGRCRLAFEVPFLAFPYLSVCRLAAGRIRRMAEGG